jgi:hypothetical protein
MHRGGTLSGRGPGDRTGRGGTLTGAVAVAALALTGCGSISAAEAGNSAATGSSQQAGPSAPAVPPSHLLCSEPAAASRVVVARTGFPRVMQPGHPKYPVGVNPAQTAPAAHLAHPAQAGQAGQPAPAQAAQAAPAQAAQAAQPTRTASPVPPVQPSQGTPGGAVTPPRLLPRPIVVRVVKNAALVHSLARELCALPPMSRQPIRCPALFTGSYELTFTVNGRRLPVVTVHDSGCQLVTGLVPVRTAAASPRFRALLTRIAGPIPLWPVHLPGGPGSGGCTPPGIASPPWMWGQNCQGPYRPGVSGRT